MLFTFPSRYWFTIGCRDVFSLGRWSSRIHARFHVPRATWVPEPGRSLLFAYGAITLFDRSFQRVRLSIDFFTSRGELGHLRSSPTTPEEHAAPTPGGSSGLGCSPFARRYLENRGCFLFLKVLRYFSSPRSRGRTYGFSAP